VASLDLDVSALGVSAQAAGEAGGDMASSSLALSSPDGQNPFPFATFDVLSGDFQRIRFEVAGGDLPEFIEVDVTFSVSVSVEDRSTVASEEVHFPFAQAGFEVLEADTVTFDPVPQVFAPFSALGIVDPSITNGPDSVDVVDTTETMSVRPNTDYWVRQITQSMVALFEGDLSGLDVSMSAFVDPTFALNPEFAASNPEIAAALTIDRVLTVPEPRAEALTAAALAVLVALRRSLRRRPAAGSA